MSIAIHNQWLNLDLCPFTKDFWKQTKRGGIGQIMILETLKLKMQLFKILEWSNC